MTQATVTAKLPSQAITSSDLPLAGNDGGSALTADVAIGGASLAVADVANYPVPCIVRVGNERILATTRSAPSGPGTLGGLTRAYDGSVETAHKSGSRVFLSYTAYHANRVQAELIAISQVLTGATSLLHGLTIEATTGAEVPLTLLLHDEVTDVSSSAEKFISFKRETGGVTSEVGSIVYDYANDQLELRDITLTAGSGANLLLEDDRQLRLGTDNDGRLSYNPATGVVEYAGVEVQVNATVDLAGNRLRRHTVFKRGKQFYTSIRTDNTFITHDTTQGRIYVFRPGGVSPPGSPSRYYSPATDTYTDYAPPPDALGEAAVNFNFGSAGAYDGSRYIYVVSGGNYKSFARFDTLNASAHGAALSGTIADRGIGWTMLTDVPVPVGLGAALFYANGAVYCLVGGNRRACYKYNIAGNTWAAIADMPAKDVPPGNGEHTIHGYAPFIGTVLGGTHIVGATLHHFVRLDATTDTWSTDWTASRYVVGDGSMLVQDTATNDLYHVRGLDTPNLAKFTMGTSVGGGTINHKLLAPNLPVPVATGGLRAAIATVNSEKRLYLWPGNGTGRLIIVPITDLTIELDGDP